MSISHDIATTNSMCPKTRGNSTLTGPARINLFDQTSLAKILIRFKKYKISNLYPLTYITKDGQTMVDYNNNEGIGGFQQGSYRPLAIHPIDANWTRQSRFRAPTSLSVLKRVVDSGRPDFSYGLSSFTVDEQGRAILAVGQGDFELNHQYGKPYLPVYI